MNANRQWWWLWFFSAKFMVSVSGVVLNSEGQILLQRHRHWVPEVWGLPGGIIRRKETIEQALAREVREETGLAIDSVELLKMVSGYKYRMEAYCVAHLVETGKAPVMKLQKNEVLEARFYPFNELPANLLPLQRTVIDQAEQYIHPKKKSRA